MIFPEPVISIAIEPKTKADVEKLGVGSAEARRTRTRRSASHTDEETGQTIISGMGELHLEIIVDRLKREFKVESNVGKPEVAYREAITQEARSASTSTRSSPAAAASTATSLMEIEPGERGTGFVFENDIVGGVIPKEFIPGDREGHPRGDGPRRPRRLSRSSTCKRRLYDGSYHEVDSQRAGLRGRGVAVLPGRRQARRPAPARADHEDRGRRPRAVHGRRHRRPELASRPNPGHEPARQRAGHRRRGSARDDVRLRHRPAHR